MNKCHSCLKDNNEEFCRSCSKKFFGSSRLSNILQFSRPEFNEVRLANSYKLSISGVQVKYSLKLEKKQLVLTNQGGQYIIKPIPYGSFKYMDSIPANEHLTMQIANQVFKIKTALNALMHFKDNEPAYIVKRFDVLENGEKVLQEDFAQIADKTEDNAGQNYKYEYSYEEIALLMKKFVAAYPIEAEKFYSLVIFNYLIGNGDAHVKNFSLFRNNQFGDYTLTPAYDLLNTNLHIPNEPDTALELFKDGFESESYKSGSKFTSEDFYIFGKRIGMKEPRIKNILNNFIMHKDQIETLTNKSFLADDLKAIYLEIVNNRRERLKF